MKRHKTSTFFIGLIILLSSIFVAKLQKSETQARELLTLYKAEKKQTEMIGKSASPHLATQSLGALYAYEFDRSLEFADKAVLRDSENKSAWTAKALVHFYRQEFRAAKNALIKAERSPTNRAFSKIIQSVLSLKNDHTRLTASEYITVLHKIPTQTQKRIMQNKH